MTKKVDNKNIKTYSFLFNKVAAGGIKVELKIHPRF